MEDRHRSRHPEQRRLETPGRAEPRSVTRSRSRVRTTSPSHARRNRGSTPNLERIEILENELRRERERLDTGSRHCSPLRRDSARRAGRCHRASAATSWREAAGRHKAVRTGSHAEQRDDAGEPKRSRSPSFSKKDVIDILNCLKGGLASQSSTQAALPVQKLDHKNILPNFDPSTKNQRMDVWLKKVNECASVYGWDERTTTHFAMQKLQGLAKTWYEGLNTILFTWNEWQEKLLNAFPYEQNYGQVLEDMLKRKSKHNEAIEVYYYEKLTLVNQCDIVGKRAVDCIIHGITDRTIRSGALALRCSNPDQLLQYLVSNKDSQTSQSFGLERYQYRNKNSDGTAANTSHYSGSNQRTGERTSLSSGCYNCKERGHSFIYCPKPLIKCTRCNRFGHLADACRSRPTERFASANNGIQTNASGQANAGGQTNAIKKTMCIDSIQKPINSYPNSKFMKEVVVNGSTLRAFVDFGSEVTLMKSSVASGMNLSHNGVPMSMKGFGNSIVQSLGEVSLDLSIDGVVAKVPCKVVDDTLLDMPMLIGQSYTEQPHIVVYKTVNRLNFLDIGKEMLHPDFDLNLEPLVKLWVPATVELHGPVSVRAQTETDVSGSILLKNSVAGKPNEQYFTCGGLHHIKRSQIWVTLLPYSGHCNIPAKTVLCRAERVASIKRVAVSPPELPVALESDFDVSQVRVGDAVPDAIKRRLLELLEKFKHCFASSLDTLGCTGVTEMQIELTSQRPVVYRPYRLSHFEREKVRSMVDEMLNAGIVRESVSNYASPILLVRKKDGSLRMCVDYRMLNSVTIKERYPMPIIEDEIARLTGQACFITLDLSSGYYQVPISAESKHLTSFVTPDGQYEFNRMPFGLANAPAVFQRMMNTILGSARYNKATAYIDDILIFGKNQSECLDRLEEVLHLIENANLTLNLAKCDFLKDRIDYLGYEISADGVRPGEKKILSVANFPRPDNIHNVRQFLGLASYFRKFIENFAQIAFPLSRLLRKGEVWVWGTAQDEAFETLKARLVNRPILAIYDPAAETELHTDASRVGIGGILLQRSTDGGSFRPVAYYSRQTSPEERNFHSYELEALAVVCSLRKFRVYLLGKEFKIMTDCSALRSTFSKRDLIPRIARWWLSLQEFNCTVEYRAGTKMCHVDALSRNPSAEYDSSLDQLPTVMSISNEDWLQTLQLGDSELQRIRDIISSDLDEKELRYLKDNYVTKDSKLYRCLGGDRHNIRWVVPKGARWQLCRMNHDDIGHFGVEKTLERMKKNYWFAKMSRFVKKYVGACIECAYAKNSSNDREGLLHPITKVAVPFDTLHVDHLGPFVKSARGYTHLLVVVDAFTKFCFIRPVRNTNTNNTIRVLEDIFSTFRTPNRLISDRGSCYTAHAFKRFCLDKGVRHVLNAVASPRSNGQVERYNRTILDSLKALCIKHGEKNWDSLLGQIQWGLNNTIQKTTGKAPSEVLFGTYMNGEMKPVLNEIAEDTRHYEELSTIRDQVKNKIDFEQSKQKEYFDKGRKPARQYAEGDLVKITRTCFNNDGQSKKLLVPFVGPYRVTKALGRDRYVVAPVVGLNVSEGKRPKTVAADRMMPWIHVAALEVNENDSDSSDNNEDD